MPADPARTQDQIQDHNAVVQHEFTRQAETFRAAKTLDAPEVTQRIGQAIGAPVARLLDIACGPGKLFPTLTERTQQLFGMDLTRETLRLAAQRQDAPKSRLVQGQSEQLPFADDSLDVVVLRLALHHFEQPQDTLLEVHRVLRPEGRVVVLDVLGSEDSRMARLRDAIERVRDPSHTRLLAAGAMRSLLTRTGFALDAEERFETNRTFEEWATILASPQRMSDLEEILRALMGAGERIDMELRDEDGVLAFTYRWGLFVARRA